MQRIIFQFFVPVIAGLIAALSLNYWINIKPSKSASKLLVNTKEKGIYIDAFSGNQALEDLLLVSGEENTITLFGSSELSIKGDAAPQNFIPLHTNFRVKTVGHAGNQCLSILCQLLAKKQQVKDAKIIIILSPGWFESKASLGTSSTVFLEYNSERFLRNWVDDESEEANYARKRMADFFPEINSPGLNLHAHFFQHIGTKSPLHYAAAMPFCELNKLMGIEKKDKSIFKNPPLNDSLLKPIAWDSLFNASAIETLANSSNNEFGINNDYFNSYIGNKRGNIQSVPLSLNTELSDFLALLKFIRKNNIDAAFVISPLNALYYKNLKKLDPVIDILAKEINGNGKEKSFPLLNLFTSNPSTYNKEILTDVMHLSNHGWYKVNKFILETYP